MQVIQHSNIRADRPRHASPPVIRPILPSKKSSFRPEPEGLSREELRKIVLDQLG
jgi:hypothetical protein